MSPENIALPVIKRAMRDRAGRPLVVGICGAQGSGKSTLANTLADRLEGAATLSLDDLYLTRAGRMALADEVHPLLRTRGVPGTHDVSLGMSVLDAIAAEKAVRLPRFCKAIDDRLSEAQWPIAPAGTRVLLLEGWCVGAVPQPEDALIAPVNALEWEADASGTWRRHVNAALAGPYQALFARLDLLILLAAPRWETVLTWRLEQEESLRRSGARGAGVMSDGDIEVFVSHYERLTRHILHEMPGRCDLLIQLDLARNPRITGK